MGNSIFYRVVGMIAILTKFIFIGSSNGYSTGNYMTHDLIGPKDDKADTDGRKNNMIALVNCYRACHSVNSLTRSTKIEQQSDSWAQYLGSSGNFQHSNSDYGENLYAGRVSQSGSEAINAWYFECFGKYVYNSENNPSSCGHFTQLVWKSSQSIGIGLGASSSYGTIVVANFDPPGNFRGRYSVNVPAPDDKCVQRCKGGRFGQLQVLTNATAAITE